MKCRLCGCEKETRRQMHGHMMKQHYDDYKRADFRLERVCTEVVAAKHKEKEKENYQRPAGFRLLRRGNAEESNAIDQGFDFIDDDNNIYTEEEARAEKWI